MADQSLTRTRPLEIDRHCPSCGHDHTKLFSRLKQRVIRECSGCGLRALSPMPSFDDLIETNKETVHPFFKSYLEDEESYRRYFEAKLNDLERAQPSGSLLDVGCGAGIFLDAARERGYDVAGVDLSPVPVEHARNELGLDVEVGSLYDYNAPEGRFHIVTIFQTIEHDPHPDRLAAELFRMLTPGGLLMVTTPAADGFVARAMGTRWFGYRNVEHVSFFTRQSLRHLLEAAGFEVVSLELEHGKRLTPKYVLNRLINYYYDHKRFLRRGLGILRPVTAVLSSPILFEPWAHLYAIARKPKNLPSG